MKQKLTLMIILVSITASSLFAQVEENLNALEWRFIGPMTGTRGSVVLGHPIKTSEFYFGASNGLWKTEDAGIYWMPVEQRMVEKHGEKFCIKVKLPELLTW